MKGLIYPGYEKLPFVYHFGIGGYLFVTYQRSESDNTSVTKIRALENS